LYIINNINVKTFGPKFTFWFSLGYVPNKNKDSKTTEISITGYVDSVSEVKTAMQKSPKKSPTKPTSKYFDFDILSEKETRRAVCFSPQKRKLIADVQNESDVGLEFKKKVVVKLWSTIKVLSKKNHSSSKKKGNNCLSQKFKIV